MIKMYLGATLLCGASLLAMNTDEEQVKKEKQSCFSAFFSSISDVTKNNPNLGKYFKCWSHLDQQAWYSRFKKKKDKDTKFFTPHIRREFERVNKEENDEYIAYRKKYGMMTHLRCLQFKKTGLKKCVHDLADNIGPFPLLEFEWHEEETDPALFDNVKLLYQIQNFDVQKAITQAHKEKQ